MRKQLSYCLLVSHARILPRSVAAAEIYVDARASYPAAGITGFLHQEDGFFVHYLEGPRGALNRVLNRIRSDWRGGHVTVRAEGTRDARLFEGWDMAFTEQEVNAFKHRMAQLDRVSSIATASDEELLDFFHAMAPPAAAEDPDTPTARVVRMPKSDPYDEARLAAE